MPGVVRKMLREGRGDAKFSNLIRFVRLGGLKLGTNPERFRDRLRRRELPSRIEGMSPSEANEH